jgi:hypothetical protein
MDRGSQSCASRPPAMSTANVCGHITLHDARWAGPARGEAVASPTATGMLKRASPWRMGPRIRLISGCRWGKVHAVVPPAEKSCPKATRIPTMMFHQAEERGSRNEIFAGNLHTSLQSLLRLKAQDLSSKSNRM